MPLVSNLYSSNRGSGGSPSFGGLGVRLAYYNCLSLNRLHGCQSSSVKPSQAPSGAFQAAGLTAARVVAKSHFRNGGANLPVCRGAQQGAAHHFGNDFWQSLKTHHAQKRLGVLAPNERKERNERNLFVGSRKMTELSLPNPLSSALPGLNLDVGR